MGEPEMSGAEKIANYIRYWKKLAWLTVACKSIALALLLAALCWFLTQDRTSTQLVFSFTLLGGIILFYRQSGLGKLKPALVARLFNQHYPKLEYSSQLLLEEPEGLSVPARLQRKKVAQQLSREKLKNPPVRLLEASLWLLIALLVSSLLIYFAGFFYPTGLPGERGREAGTTAADTVFTETLQEAIPALKEGRLRVSPPDYTRQDPYYTQLASLRAPEGSRLTWQLEFSEKVNHLWLVLSTGDSLAFSLTAKGRFTTQLVLTNSVLYQLVWQYGADKINTTEYLRLEAIPDETPLLQIQQPEQYSREQTPMPIRFEGEVSDDYGLTDAYLQLTISQGSGENVSFREEKVWFEQEFSSQPKKVQLRKTLDPGALGMVPGDELYYYLVAFDNRQPKVQRSRSETWFYHWLDTANQSAFEMSGMAMDIMPDYFRSQRQIIIDTEKLIKERPRLSEEEFEQRANNLGVDQKLLRLRYGKFLGEEFESGYGSPEPGRNEGAHPEHEGEEHAGEEQEEEGALPGEVEHEHTVPAHEEPVAPSGGALLREFMHAHDTEEGATFYEESIKVKLKAALAEMWESELRLRTLRPKEALPFQYRALEIIKNVQQATRIYVERIGFEPPALKPAEKRLTGELNEVASVGRTSSTKPVDSLAAIRELVPVLQRTQQPEKELARRAGQELAAIVQLQPVNAYLQALKSIAKLAEGESPPEAGKQALLRTLYSLLPDARYEIRKRPPLRTSLEEKFMQKVGGADE